MVLREVTHARAADVARAAREKRVRGAHAAFDRELLVQVDCGYWGSSCGGCVCVSRVHAACLPSPHTRHRQMRGLVTQFES